MKKNMEYINKMHSRYVSDDCIQLMLSYRNLLMFFGNQDVKYLKNYIDESTNSINTYLEDERRKQFPYSTIPEHIERVLLLYKVNFANQLLDFEKPYIRVNDGFIVKMTAYKDHDGALVHSKILNGIFINSRTVELSRDELENYLKTGTSEKIDEDIYEECIIFDGSGRIFNPKLEQEQVWIDREKQRLINIIKENYEYGSKTKEELISAIELLDDIEPSEVTQKALIKFKNNGEIIIDNCNIKYNGRDKYIVMIRNIPVTMESLSMIKSKAELPAIKQLREPKISLRLNPNITKEQLEEEKAKVLTRSRNLK